MKDFIPCIILAILYLVFYHVLAADAGQVTARQAASPTSDSRQVKCKVQLHEKVCKICSGRALWT
jgi:hypothetical protein